ncbi:MAG: S41 family peptidase [Bacteroidales bacterium]|nr:S41 family peptidase [Bacteroidales bacterium]MBQ5604206.1 S41 family peptidase [Bacteroidales bacterium]
MKNSIKNLLLIIVCIVLCFMLGRSLYQVASSNKRMAMLKSQISSNKLDAVLNLVATKYVEEVDTKEIIEKLIPDVLKELDPHSVYIPAKEMEKTMEEMEGSFSGVGIQFNIREDTIRVISVINGGPAEQAGMRAGDCIVSVDDSVFVGDKINNDLVLKTLRGPKHSKVKVGIARRGTEEILPFTLVRDDIPLTSVDASYKIGENIAYIKVGSFSRTTYDEFLNKMVKLKQVDHCDRLILDLRSNPGGLMGAALAILNEFLPKNRLMLYVEGKSYPREESYSDGRGSFKDMPVVVLMDEWSASASEIVAGSIQDNDRGYIVGRRSYGKGLVQQQIPFKDKSAVRLTVAHYYVPSGRSIQKPYTKGDFEDYELDIVRRWERGEFGSLDSIHLDDSLCFETRGGRRVYGGGGILPDYFVPLDTTSNQNDWFVDVANKNLIYNFAASYVDAHRAALLQQKTVAELKSYLQAQDIFAQFVRYTREKGVKSTVRQTREVQKEVQLQLNAYIARNTMGEDIFWELLQEEDKTLLKAIELIQTMDNNVADDKAAE